MEEKRKINKAEGVRQCSEHLFSGLPTKEIIRTMGETYGVSRSTVEKWINAARPIAQELQREAEEIRRREMEAAVQESAKRLNISRERVLEEYAKLAFFDIRKIFTVDGGLKNVTELDDESAGAIAGIESFDQKVPETEMVLGTTQKVKIANKKEALDSICKVMGYFNPTKLPIDPDGGEGDDRTDDQLKATLKSILSILE